MTAIACVGIAVQDIVFRLGSIPTTPGKYHAIERNETGGGVAANAAVAISRLGGEARLIGAVGDDPAGDAILADLEAEGVATKSVRRVAGIRSPLSAVVVDRNGERLIVNHTDDRVFADVAIPSQDELDGSDGVLADVRWPPGSSAALQWARNHDVPGVLDFDVGSRPTGQLIHEASHVVFSAKALTTYVGEASPTDALMAVLGETDAFVAVTAGAEGVYWLEGDQLKHMPAFDIQVQDTTGAGDVFHGAFALAVADSGRDMSETMRFASAAAAITCVTFGGRAGVPNQSEVQAFLKEHA